jgi:hypothetical protein
MKLNRKRIFLIVAGFLLLAQSQKSFAQNTANATLNVVLSDVRSIKVNPSQTNVSLVFANSADYNNGVSSDQVAHLEVTSTGGYAIKVKSSGPTLVNGANSIPVNTITLTPTVGTQKASVGAGVTAIIPQSSNTQMGSLLAAILNPTAVNFITSPTGVTKQFYDVKYNASGGTSYINKAAGTYTTTITYSIEPL